MAKTILIKDVRCIYPNLTEAKAYKNGKPKYSISFIFPKKDKERYKEISDIIKSEVANSNLKEGQKKQALKQALDFNEGTNKYCLIKDGDIVNLQRGDLADKEPIPAFEGQYVVKFPRPKDFGVARVVDRSNNKIELGDIRSKIQSGYWVNLAVTARVYVSKESGEAGVAFTLQGVQFVKEDEIFGVSNPFEAFEDADEPETKDDSSPFN